MTMKSYAIGHYDITFYMTINNEPTYCVTDIYATSAKVARNIFRKKYGNMVIVDVHPSNLDG